MYTNIEDTEERLMIMKKKKKILIIISVIFAILVFLIVGGSYYIGPSGFRRFNPAGNSRGYKRSIRRLLENL